MTKLGWISAILFATQAAVFGILISDYSRFAEAGSYQFDQCFRLEENAKLSCIESVGRNVRENQDMVLYSWIGLALGSALTLFGVWKGRRDA